MIEIHFVLVEPQVPQNIGAAARAIKTMGFSSLRLVRPADHLSVEARMLAHGSTEVLEAACVYESLDVALEDCGLRIATTAKHRVRRGDLLRVEELPEMILAKEGAVRDVAVVFGTESRGLSNDEIGLCDVAAHVAMPRAYPSLNLAQAVMVFAHRLSVLRIGGGLTARGGGSGGGSETDTKKRRPPSDEAFAVMKERSRRILRAIGFRETMPVLNRLEERIAALSAADARLLLSVIARLERSLPQSDQSCLAHDEMSDGDEPLG